MKVKRSEFVRTTRKVLDTNSFKGTSTLEPWVERYVQGARGVRVLVWRNDNGPEMFEGQYLHIFTGEWISPFGGEFDVHLYSDVEEALKHPKKMYEVMAERITKKTLMDEKNIEKRRKYMEFLGTTEYVKRLDLELIAEEKDNLGKPMRLYKSKHNEPSLTPSSTMRRTERLRQTRLWFLMVTDSSTDREYYLSVREQQWRGECPKDICSRVKASTFENLPLWGRQGDVGIVKLKREPTVRQARAAKDPDGFFRMEDLGDANGSLSMEKPNQTIET